MITFGESGIQRIYYNNNDIIRVYAGDTLVWPDEDDQDYLCLSMDTSKGSGDIAIALCPSTVATDRPSVEYSYDLLNWTSIDMTSWSEDKLSSSDPNNIILTPSRSKVYFRGNNPGGFNHKATVFDGQQTTATYFKINAADGLVKASGNIMSLLGLDITAIPNAYCFTGLFWGCSQLSTAPELPAMTLTRECYGHMFEFCTELTQSPVLPASTVPVMGYGYMFRNCSKLNQIECHATNVEDDGMYYWVVGVATSGVFIGTNKFKEDYNDRIPLGWTFNEI